MEINIFLGLEMRNNSLHFLVFALIFTGCESYCIYNHAMLSIRSKLIALILITLSFSLLSIGFSQETMTTEERLTRLEKAVTNLEEYALLLHYNQIGSVSEFETRIGELERSFSFIVGEVVQLQPAGTTSTAPTSRSTPTTQPTQVSQPAQTVQSPQPTLTQTGVPSVPAASDSGEELVYLQVGAYNDAASAAVARVEIEKLGYSVYEGPSGQTIRLFLGPFRLSDVDTMKLWLSQQGIDSFVVR